MTLERATVTVNGVERSFFMYAPANIAELREYDARGVRIVISLHDNGQDGQMNADRTRWSEVADTHGFIVLFPNAVDRTWNVGSADELAFINAASSAMKTRFSLASNAQMYLTGIGSGAAYAHQLAIVAPELAGAVAGVGDVAPAPTFELPADQRPVSAMAAWIVRTNSAPLSLNEIKQVAYWSNANGASGVTGTDSTPALDTVTYAHPSNEVQAVKVSTLRAGVRGESKAVSEQIWTEMFDRTIRFPDHTGTNGTLHRNESIASMKLLENHKRFHQWPPALLDIRAC
ncbi:alpha/beta hydrolase family esterase [Hydrogenophaga sp. UC242_53]|uniref:alpha/beta hydrolase family esterase n=1 Tax=Hydrogenophaga sp. UC242_53 TaxID=3350170 RepID=UPI0036D3BCED